MDEFLPQMLRPLHMQEVAIQWKCPSAGDVSFQKERLMQRDPREQDEAQVPESVAGHEGGWKSSEKPWNVIDDFSLLPWPDVVLCL